MREPFLVWWRHAAREGKADNLFTLIDASPLAAKVTQDGPLWRSYATSVPP
jgi:hypothetical protein